MEIRKIGVPAFLNYSGYIPVADVRSPSEFRSGHIPGAINIPLFNDSERAAVGIKYKNEGWIPAIIEGLKSIGTDLSSKMQQGLKIAKDGKLLVHCWRGGMRSEAMAWLFSLGNIDVQILDGGYKSYRTHILDVLSEKRKMIVLGGMTGTGKTCILKFLTAAGHQVIDLENLAAHKGSAFGALGQKIQPTTEHFGNLLFDEFNRLNTEIPFWLEDESKNIGSVFLPGQFYQNMQNVPVIVLNMDIRLRLPHLMKEYSAFPPETLIESVLKINKRLGGDRTKEAIDAIKACDFARAIEIVLFYYDKSYQYGLRKKESGNLIFVETETDDPGINAMKVLEASKKIVW